MSYDVEIVDPATNEARKFNQPVDVRGGTYAVEGTSRAWLNITYNYSWFYYKIWPAKDGVSQGSIRHFEGKTVEETRPELEAAVQDLGIREWKDYWAPTPGNAGKALQDLLVLMALCEPTDTLRIS